MIAREVLDFAAIMTSDLITVITILIRPTFFCPRALRTSSTEFKNKETVSYQIIEYLTNYKQTATFKYMALFFVICYYEYVKNVIL